MAPVFSLGNRFPKETCNSCTAPKFGFEKCNLGFEKCVYGENMVSLMKKHKRGILISTISLRDVVNKTLLELEKENPSKISLKSAYDDLFTISDVFSNQLSSFEDVKALEMSLFLRQQIKHHYLNTMTVVTSGIYSFYKLKRDPEKIKEQFQDVLKRLDSLEKIIKNIEKNPQLVDYLFAQYLPCAINELELPSS